MIDLDRIFENWFANPQFSTTEKLNFAESTRNNLAANNTGGEFDEVLPLLQAAFTAAGGNTGSEEVALAVRKAAVQAKRTLLETIKGTISRRSGRISDTFGKGGVEWLEFFPQGLTPYREMNETDVETKLTVLLAAAKKFDPALETELIALQKSWLAAKKAAGDKISAAGTADLSQDAAMTQLEMILMKVIFTAGLAFTGRVEMGPKLFDQSRLYNSTAAADAAPSEAPVKPA